MLRYSRNSLNTETGTKYNGIKITMPFSSYTQRDKERKSEREREREI